MHDVLIHQVSSCSHFTEPATRKGFDRDLRDIGVVEPGALFVPPSELQLRALKATTEFLDTRSVVLGVGSVLKTDTVILGCGKVSCSSSSLNTLKIPRSCV